MIPSDTLSGQDPDGHVVIRCPSCGAADTVSAAAMAGSPTIVCRECGETWPEGVARRGKPVRRQGEVIDAEKKALVSYSDKVAADAWKSKIEGDHWPEPARPSRVPMLAAAMAALLFFAAFFAGRQAAVAALPDLAGLYAAIGLPVNLEGFEIEDVKAERVPTFGGSRLALRATLRNVSNSEQAIPPLAAVLLSDAMLSAGAYGFDPPQQTLDPGETLTLTMALEGAPKDAAEAVVRFRRRGETLAVAGDAQPLQP